MRPIHRRPVLAAAGAVAVLLAANPVFACMCAPPPPPAQALEQSAAVFAGRVLSVERAEREAAGHRLPQMRVTLELKAVWKGLEDSPSPEAKAEKEPTGGAGGGGKGGAAGEPAPGGRTVVVWTGLGGGDCGYGFEEGKSYLVYAHDLEDGGLTTGICTRTRPLDRARDDLQALGEPTPHQQR